MKIELFQEVGPVSIRVEANFANQQICDQAVKSFSEIIAQAYTAMQPEQQLPLPFVVQTSLGLPVDPAPIKRTRKAVAPEPIVVAPEPIVVAPEPIVVAPEPIVVAPEPIVVAPEPIVVAPEPISTEREAISDSQLQRYCGRLAAHFGGPDKVFELAGNFVTTGTTARPTNITAENRHDFIAAAQRQTGVVYHA